MRYLATLVLLAVALGGCSPEEAEARPTEPPALLSAKDRVQPEHRMDRDRPENDARMKRIKAPRPSAMQLHLRCSACPGHTREFDRLIVLAAARAGLDACKLRAQVCKESSFRPEVCSEAGACGLMQLLEGTARDLRVKDRFDARDNLMGGARYQAWQKRNWHRYNRTDCQRDVLGYAGFHDGLGVPLSCQEQKGGLQLGDFGPGCVSDRGMNYARSVAIESGDAQCVTWEER